jgi:hypothetical protein
MLSQVRATSVSRGGWSIRLASFGFCTFCDPNPADEKTEGQRTAIGMTARLTF